jgi:hypothetical protein
MEHGEIIQKILDKSIKKNYLEIGVATGENFVAINANYKVGVDPIQPSNLVTQSLNATCLYHQMTSDAFFANTDNPCVKFDVVFIDGLHEYEQAYRDITNSVTHLAANGVIVVHDCKPTNKDMASPLRGNTSTWTGNVWKAIVRLRSLHNDLFVCTLDCDFGCAVITISNPESLLSFSLHEIDAMDFDYLCTDYTGLLNLKHPEYLFTFLKYNSGFTLGLISYQEAAAKQVYVSGEYGSRTISLSSITGTLETPEAQCTFHIPPDYIKLLTKGTIVAPGQILIHNGKLLPDTFRFYLDDCEHAHLEKLAEGKYLPKHSVQPRTRIDEPCFYFDGEYSNHYGHFLLEVLSRLWCFTDMDLANFRFITSMANLKMAAFFLKPFRVKPEQIVHTPFPVVCDKLIVASQSIVCCRWISPKAFSIYDAISNYYANKQEIAHQRIYVSRSKLNHGRKLLNEQIIEDIFRKNGFHIIYPEAMSLYEQINIFHGASIVAGCKGSGLHNTVFSNKLRRLIVLTPREYIDSRAYNFPQVHGRNVPVDDFINSNKHCKIEYLTGSVFDKNVNLYYADWIIDCNMVEKYLTDTI